VVRPDLLVFPAQDLLPPSGHDRVRHREHPLRPHLGPHRTSRRRTTLLRCPTRERRLDPRPLRVRQRRTRTNDPAIQTKRPRRDWSADPGVRKALPPAKIQNTCEAQHYVLPGDRWRLRLVGGMGPRQTGPGCCSPAVPERSLACSPQRRSASSAATSGGHPSRGAVPRRGVQPPQGSCWPAAGPRPRSGALPRAFVTSAGSARRSGARAAAPRPRRTLPAVERNAPRAPGKQPSGRLTHLAGELADTAAGSRRGSARSPTCWCPQPIPNPDRSTRASPGHVPQSGVLTAAAPVPVVG